MRKLKVKKIIVLLFIIVIGVLGFILKNDNKKETIKNEIVKEDYYKYILVNKKNGLGENFIPNNLVEVKKCVKGEFYLYNDAAHAYHQMCLDMIDGGLNISITSAYRSYDEQYQLYNYYLKKYGKNYVNKYVAVAGYSEHQTGLAIDLKSLNSATFKNSTEYLWIKDNAHNYGFIIRYEEEKEHITEYSAEEWHIRYVGKKAANYIYENNITFEEYYNLFLKQ